MSLFRVLMPFLLIWPVFDTFFCYENSRRFFCTNCQMYHPLKFANFTPSKKPGCSLLLFCSSRINLIELSVISNGAIWLSANFFPTIPFINRPFCPLRFFFFFVHLTFTTLLLKVPMQSNTKSVRNHSAFRMKLVVFCLQWANPFSYALCIARIF